MSKLNNLTTDDLEHISEFISTQVNEYLFEKISIKEIIDLDIHVENSYENEQLDVDVSVDLELDDLSKVNEDDIIQDAIDYALENLDLFLDENYRQ